MIKPRKIARDPKELARESVARGAIDGHYEIQDGETRFRVPLQELQFIQPDHHLNYIAYRIRDKREKR